MAEPLAFPESNMEWYGKGDIAPLPAFRDPDTGQSISCWQLGDAELAEVSRTGKVWLRVWGIHPPVFVEGTDPFTDPVGIPPNRDSPVASEPPPPTGDEPEADEIDSEDG